MNLPTRATSLDGEIASHQVMIKTPRQNIKPHAPHFRRQVLRHGDLISHRRRTGSRKKRPMVRYSAVQKKMLYAG